LLPTLNVALNCPVLFGENLRLSAALWPAATDTGKVGAVMVKYFEEIATLWMLIASDPEFVAVTVSVLLLPGATLPKLTALPSPRLPICCCDPEPEELKPWQPTITASASMSRTAPVSL
jgi:hypothetical protein